MSCKRVYFQSAVYHVIFRGNNRQKILKLKHDKRDLLATIRKYQERKSFKVYAMVIMDNHVHMVMGVNDMHNISKVMQSILLSFSTKYRRKYDYVGHVWQGRFISKPIGDEKYFLECLQYIHHNPLKAGIVERAIDYPYSSARFYEGLKSKEIDGFVEFSRYGTVLP